MTESMTNKIAEPEVGGSLTAKETELTKEAGPEEPKKVIHPADVIVPTWEVFELRHRLTRSDVSQAERTKDQDELITYIRKDSMPTHTQLRSLTHINTHTHTYIQKHTNIYIHTNTRRRTRCRNVGVL